MLLLISRTIITLSFSNIYKQSKCYGITIVGITISHDPYHIMRLGGVAINLREQTWLFKINYEYLTCGGSGLKQVISA